MYSVYITLPNLAWENGCKDCAHHFNHLEVSWKKNSTTAFYPIIVDVHPWKNILLARYRVSQKTVKFVPVVPKVHVRAKISTFVRTKSLLSHAIFKNVLGLFIGFLYLVVHPCSNFSLCHQMAPLRSIKFPTVNFLIFCARIIVIFWITCIGREVFFCCGNGQWETRPASIAVLQRRHCFCF